VKYPQTILITGANGQIASALTAELLSLGCHLQLVTHQRQERIKPVVATHLNQVQLLSCDLTSYADTLDTFQKLSSGSGCYPSAVIHTAAIRSYDAKALFDSDPQIWQQVFNANIVSAYNVLRCTLPAMVKQNSGKIVLLGSNVTRTGLPYGTAYAASKAAMANLVRSTAQETAPYNVQINQVSPAPVQTNLAEDYTGEYLAFRERYFGSYIANHPAHKLVSIYELNQVILQLLRIDITAQSGEEIFVTGGVL
jgi:NAD(P)-dependent dehydrogenase (short-subunit alcohol dehydrogenase family)